MGTLSPQFGRFQKVLSSDSVCSKPENLAVMKGMNSKPEKPMVTQPIIQHAHTNVFDEKVLNTTALTDLNTTAFPLSFFYLMTSAPKERVIRAENKISNNQYVLWVLPDFQISPVSLRVFVLQKVFSSQRTKCSDAEILIVALKTETKKKQFG